MQRLTIVFSLPEAYSEKKKKLKQKKKNDGDDNNNNMIIGNKMVKKTMKWQQ